MSSKNEIDTDPLQKLLNYAGRREAVEPLRAKRVERHLTDHWRQLMEKNRTTARRRRMGGLVSGFAVAASVVMAIVFFPRSLGPTPVVAHVQTTIGIVEGGARGEPLTRLATGAALRAGSILETADEAGVGVELLSGHSLRVAAASRIRIEPDAVILDQGSIYLDSGPTGRVKPITVHSSFATLRELGTQYQARLLTDGLEVSVREGMINLERNGGIVTARAGESVRLESDGNVNREAITNYGERWHWVSELSPVFDLNGRTVAEFLHWLSRENGWRVSFATTSLQRHAQTIKLSGSLDGLAPDEALATVMAIVPWPYTLTDGVVTVGTNEKDLEQ